MLSLRIKLIVALFFALASSLALAFSAGSAFAQSPGPMSAGHADMNGALDCNKCHDAGFGVPDAKCLGCHEHQQLRDRIKANKGFHADKEVKEKTCSKCHAEHVQEPPGSGKGRKTTIDWRPFGGKKNFEHQRTGWPLQGAHRFEDCEACHKKKYKTTKLPNYLGLATDCASCHAKENPHQFVDTKLFDCTVCHNQDNRKVTNVGVTKFDHDKTSFPLVGNHMRVECKNCHKDDIKTFKVDEKKFKDCSGCHKDPHRSVISATRKCQSCHNEKVKFAQNKFDHGKETKFALHGTHAKNSCDKCHKVDSPPEKPSMVCESCHKDFHNGRFGKETCEGCHLDGGPNWRSMRFAHDKKTKFTLTGRHTEIFCTQCHRPKEPNNFEKFKSTDCASCHAHQEAHCGQFGFENCARCHVRGGDRTSKFDHALTRFPLERAHAAVDCERCHKPAKLSESPKCLKAIKYTGLDPACVTCHEDVHKGELGATCGKCHTAGANFKTLVFDHNKDSRFALTGFHSIVACETCHPGRKYKLGDIQCISCHKEDDIHAGALGDDCAKCHETTGGAPKFDHNIQTDFKRRGTHQKIECERCHFLLQDGSSVAGEKVAPSKSKNSSQSTVSFVKTSTRSSAEVAFTRAAIAPPGAPLDLKFRAPGKECGACHPDPHKVRAALVLDCKSCHNEEQWPDPPLNGYHEKAGFALTGAHSVIQCSLCHLGSGSLLGRGEDCGTCHVQDDIHASSFGSDCGKCHEQNGWLPTSFTHVDTGYVLEGVHRTLECRQCHQSGNYFIGNKCRNCHLTDAMNSEWHKIFDPPDAMTNVINFNSTVNGSFDCGECHNQFTFDAGTFADPTKKK